MEWFTWIADNYLTILGGFATIVTGASVIAKLTPTPKDDAALAWVIKVLDFLALNTSRPKP